MRGESGRVLLLRARVQLVEELRERNPVDSRGPTHAHDARHHREEAAPHVGATTTLKDIERRWPTPQDIGNAKVRGDRLIVADTGDARNDS